MLWFHIVAIFKCPPRASIQSQSPITFNWCTFLFQSNDCHFYTVRMNSIHLTTISIQFIWHRFPVFYHQVSPFWNQFPPFFDNWSLIQFNFQSFQFNGIHFYHCQPFSPIWNPICRHHPPFSNHFNSIQLISHQFSSIFHQSLPFFNHLNVIELNFQ